jgi:hypothetical protein
MGYVSLRRRYRHENTVRKRGPGVPHVVPTRVTLVLIGMLVGKVRRHLTESDLARNLANCT